MLSLICGMPRAGKTTYSKRYDNVIHLDGIGYHQVKRMVAEITTDVAVDGIYNDSRTRERLATAYKGNGRRCIWIDTPLEIRKTRPMWQEYLGMEFEPPTFEEGWDEIIIIRGEHEQRISRQTED